MAAKGAAFNLLPIIEAEVIRGIREDTQAGKQPDGSTFEPYVPEYAKVRQALGLRISPPNLRRKAEDSLLDSLGAKRLNDNESEISVREDLEPIAKGLSQKRKFMGISEATKARAESKFNPEFERAMS